MTAPTVEHLWRRAQWPGALSAAEQCKAWAYREVVTERGETVNMEQVASSLTLDGGGNPSREAVRRLYLRMDEEGWYPGKRSAVKRGPAAVFTMAQKRRVAVTAMNLKKRKIEPTYNAIVRQAPKAVKNNNTGRPVDRKQISAVLKTLCHDGNPADPWNHETVYSKTALMDEDKNRRLKFCQSIIADGYTDGWVYRHCIWIDLCSTVLPGSEKKAHQQALARKGNKRWHSKGAKEYSRNLRAPSTAAKQCGWGDARFWWCPVLARGKLHVVTFESSFPGETSAGVAQLVERIPGILNNRFPGSAHPKVLVPDKGKGYWAPQGQQTAKFAEALANTGLRTLVGESAQDLPRDMPDLLLHETAVRWVRYRTSLTTPAKPWDEEEEEFAARMRKAVQEVNKMYDVESLCRQFVQRCRAVVGKGGDRLVT